MDITINTNGTVKNILFFMYNKFLSYNMICVLKYNCKILLLYVSFNSYIRLHF